MSNKVYWGLLTFAVAMLFISTTLQAQELVYEQREQQLAYNGYPSTPVNVFNGTDFAAFYHWAGVEDKGSGLYMRRIDRDGKPFGPQRQLMALEIRDPVVTAVWDGEAYIVFISKGSRVNWHILRVDRMGKVLGKRKGFLSTNESLNNSPLGLLVPITPDFTTYIPYVVGDDVYLFFSSYRLISKGCQPYMLMVDRELKEKLTITTLPTGGLKNPVIQGIALDPDKFLVYLGQRGTDLGINKAAMLHLDFSGKLQKTIQPTALNPQGAGPAAKVQTTDVWYASGPVYTGDGYLLFASRFGFTGSGGSFPYEISSVKIDDSGEIIEGPYDLGGSNNINYLDKPVLLGAYVGIPKSDWTTRNTDMSLVGLKGRHIKDVSILESIFPWSDTTLHAAYSGTGCGTVGIDFLDRQITSVSLKTYSNIITDPKFVKPAIVFFQAGDGSAFGDDRRLVMWSVASCTDVTLTGPDFEMTNLPPVFHTVVDTGGERTVLRLSIAGTDGSTKTKRLVIEP